MKTQICIIYSGVSGLLDNLDVSLIKTAEDLISQSKDKILSRSRSEIPSWPLKDSEITRRTSSISSSVMIDNNHTNDLNVIVPVFPINQQIHCFLLLARFIGDC